MHIQTPFEVRLLTLFRDSESTMTAQRETSQPYRLGGISGEPVQWQLRQGNEDLGLDSWNVYALDH
ncbi:uncharacterized protein FOMMEDRAFT_24146 [Fomitiporia mediterranea MF3/22]|uniref:uncharacterized protein n=1 Tax=Fomitiporia mediterranea (strain MF3/22) TaxID=694068 RepID=UPI0004408768|nr:uncharacterized protein FOMMEDRAFT_24146 [Fomitiporia mediterranea MF3/22]EJC98144.1 hypothetical protein FOMMEDRAFT_24146 [Fomitiporia mediterranea MF3/22]